MKKALLFLGLILSMLTVCAEDNVLQTIEIVPVKDTYNIVLVADKSVDVKKTVQAPNKITLNMKGIRASKTLNTVYNNVSNVDTVMVENVGNNAISVFFQAENAQDASITFDSMLPPAAKTASETKQQVKLNSPIDSYAPIYREDAAQEKTSSLFNKITQKSSSMGAEIQDSVNEASGGVGNIISYGLVGLLIFSVVRLFKRKEPDMKIGLAQQNLNDREIDMYKGASPIASNSYMSTDKPFTTVNYGLNAYKKENENPYEQAPIHNPRLQQYISPLLRNQMAQAVMQQQLAQPSPSASTMTMPQQAPVRKHTTPVNTAPVNQGNPSIDNIKFLESMAAIYDKSGRHDLAQGLKASLTKNNIKS